MLARKPGRELKSQPAITGGLVLKSVMIGNPRCCMLLIVFGPVFWGVGGGGTTQVSVALSKSNMLLEQIIIHGVCWASRLARGWVIPASLSCVEKVSFDPCMVEAKETLSCGLVGIAAWKAERLQQMRRTCQSVLMRPAWDREMELEALMRLSSVKQ